VDLIGETLILVKNSLNQHFNNVHDHNAQWVTVSNIVSQDGNLFDEATDKLVIFLANIQNETVSSTFNPSKPVGDNQFARVSPPVYINLYLLFYANFYDKNYFDGMGMISTTLSYFQQNPYFTRHSMPGLNTAIDKLTFDMVNMDIAEYGNLMSLAGAKGLPSVLYKVRMLPFTSMAIKGQSTAVQGLQDQSNQDTQSA
jgi:hypothetical protein